MRLHPITDVGACGTERGMRKGDRRGPSRIRSVDPRGSSNSTGSRGGENLRVRQWRTTRSQATTSGGSSHRTSQGDFGTWEACGQAALRYESMESSPFEPQEARYRLGGWRARRARRCGERSEADSGTEGHAACQERRPEGRSGLELET